MPFVCFQQAKPVSCHVLYLRLLLNECRSCDQDEYLEVPSMIGYCYLNGLAIMPIRWEPKHW